MLAGNLRNRGFTLIELVVALTVAALVVGVAHSLIVALGDGAAGLTEAAVNADSESNRERFLKGVVKRLNAGSLEATFDGTPDRARFKSWCNTPNGWLESCEVELTMAMVRSRSRFEVKVELQGQSQEFLLASDFEAGVLRYLSDARLGGRWMTVWGESVTAPLAIGVVIDGDTTVLRVGDRG